MNAKYYLFILLLVGVFLMPSASLACNKSCGNQKIEKHHFKKCCEMQNSAPNEKGCGGKCKNPSCQTAIPSFNLLLPNTLNFKMIEFAFMSKKETFNFLNTPISSGFFTIWTPPNIG